MSFYAFRVFNFEPENLIVVTSDLILGIRPLPDKLICALQLLHFQPPGGLRTPCPGRAAGDLASARTGTRVCRKWPNVTLKPGA